jgi:hypothetical protein
MEAVNLICFRCKHFMHFEGGCLAFPDGIPDEIDFNNNHSSPLPEQDNDIVFEESDQNFKF